MNSILIFYCIASLLIAIGLWLMLPRGAMRGRMIGVVLALIGAGMLASRVPMVESWLTRSVFQILAGVTIASAVATVTCRKPVYSAIWFALTLLTSGGLLFVHGAQFLGVATVVVYAGAILVTFLFVIMLAQPEGHAYYDRVTWEGNLAAITGAIMVGLLTMVISVELNPASAEIELDNDETVALLAQATDAAPPEAAPASQPAPASEPAAAAEAAEPDAEAAEEVDPRMQELRQGVLADEHMAMLGAQLFTRHLLEVEIAGTLLLMALVGAVAIVVHGRGPLRRGNIPAELAANDQPANHQLGER